MVLRGPGCNPGPLLTPVPIPPTSKHTNHQQDDK